MDLNHRKKRITIFEHFRGKVVNKIIIIFLQETHSSNDALNKLRDDFQEQIFFLMELRILVV